MSLSTKIMAGAVALYRLKIHARFDLKFREIDMHARAQPREICDLKKFLVLVAFNELRER